MLASLTAQAAEPVDFDSQIRPLLSDNCFPCHGPDEAERQADLRLDTQGGAFADLGGYAPFVPGEPERSVALERIFSADTGLQMPPPESKLRLSDAEKALLRRWVAEGAEWSAHWAFVPPQRPQLPLPEAVWPKNDIDHFVLQRMREAGLEPQPEASRERLLRRVTLDLTGLPPTPEEIDAFLADDSLDAYEKVVDRLLASPRYGERMAWEWLDAARYADTDGFQGDPTRTMWPWRDWLIGALNRNMPFDQFTVEMLAGDLLPGATAEQILATGFNRNHMFNGEGGRIPEETRVENVFDRAETTGTVWLGLTLTCCRCHDHKYDPISQKEYYQFYAFFNNTSEDGRSGRGKTAPVLDYLPASVRQQRDELTRQLQRVEKQLTDPLPEVDRQQAAWADEWSQRLRSSVPESRLGDWWRLGTIEAEGQHAFDHDFVSPAEIDLDAIYAEHPWRKAKDFEDGQVQPLPGSVGATYFYRTIDAPSERDMQISLGSDDAIRVWLNGTEVHANFITRVAEADQDMVDLPLRKGENHLLIKVVNTGGIAGFYFRRVGEALFGFPADLVQILKTPTSERSKEQQRLLQAHFRRQNQPQWTELDRQRQQLKKQLKELDDEAVTVMVMDSLPAGKRRETFILDRGDYQKPKDEVSAATPAFLPSMPTDGAPDRLDLASWIMDPSNPLTARVTVNRYWQTFFGRGLVASSEDFGSQGIRPTHPDLLDWLAVQFQASGWDVKAMHKLMVMSATYRQASTVTSRGLEEDPENKWLARAPRYRLPSWMLRDQALAVSGLLVPDVGGPPVKPYQPDGIWAEATFGKINYQRDSGANLYRRSLYIFWRRIVGPTVFFDEAKRQTCEVKPTRTNTPLHALTTWNETTYVEAARQLAQRIMGQFAQPRPRLTYAFRLTTGRHPSDEELEVLTARLTDLTADFSQHRADAEQLLAVGESPRDATLDVAEQAAYTLVCSLLLNLDETLTKE